MGWGDGDRTRSSLPTEDRAQQTVKQVKCREATHREATQRKARQLRGGDGMACWCLALPGPPCRQVMAGPVARLCHHTQRSDAEPPTDEPHHQPQTDPLRPAGRPGVCRVARRPAPTNQPSKHNLNHTHEQQTHTSRRKRDAAPARARAKQSRGARWMPRRWVPMKDVARRRNAAGSRRAG